MEKEGYRENLAVLMQLHPGKTVLTVKETAEALGSSISAVYDTLHRRKNPLPHQRLAGNKILIPIASLARWLS